MSEGLVIRTIPVTRFNQFIIYLSSEFDLSEIDIMIQDNAVSLVEKKNAASMIVIKSGKMNLFKGITNFSIFKYKYVIIPVNSNNLIDNSNLFLFLVPLVSKKYYLYFPDFSYREMSYFSLLKLAVLFFIIDFFSYALALIYYPIQKLRK